MIRKIDGIDKKGFVRAYMLPEELCDSIVDVYKKAPDRFKTSGSVIKSTKELDPDRVKKSTDLGLMADKEKDSPVIGKYFNYIYDCFEDYKKEFSILDTDIPLRIKESTGIQYYKPGEGYYMWHYERGISPPASERVAVFMTYLNDVEDAGTDFLYQKFTTKAAKGMTIIWPADWTHTHKGQITNKHEKYIITGWISWCPELM